MEAERRKRKATALIRRLRSYAFQVLSNPRHRTGSAIRARIPANSVVNATRKLRPAEPVRLWQPQGFTQNFGGAPDGPACRLAYFQPRRDGNRPQISGYAGAERDDSER